MVLHAGTATSYAYFTATKINWANLNGDVIVTNFEYAYDSTLVGEVTCAEKQCYKLALARKSDITWPKVIYYVEKDGDNRPWKAAYYSQDDQLIKEVLYQDFQPVLGKRDP